MPTHEDEPQSAQISNPVERRETRVLGRWEDPPEHPWASSRAYVDDCNLIAYMLVDLRALLSYHQRGVAEITPGEARYWEVHGLRRRTIVVDLERFTVPEDVSIVCFRGDRRADAAASGIEEVELDLVDELVSFPGIIAYSSMDLGGEQWANLVVHTVPEDRERWRQSERHRYAVDWVSPRAYHAVRIHNGSLPGGVAGGGAIVVTATKYWDFDVTPTWEAVRPLPHGVWTQDETPHSEAG